MFFHVKEECIGDFVEATSERLNQSARIYKTPKLIEEGYWIIVVDPEGTVENFADSHGRTIERWTPEQLSDAVR